MSDSKVHITEERLADLRAAADVGLRMSDLGPHMVHMRPDELAALVEEVIAARAQERPNAAVACRNCGCTDADCSKCIERTGEPCFWIERDLCSACADGPLPRPAESLARGICVRHALPASMVIALDLAGGLHVGCAAVEHPITARFVSVAQSIDVALERGIGGFSSFTRERAVEVARRCAKAKPESYYSEPFMPHEWVIDAILQASAALPAVSAACSHCGQEVARLDDVAAIREHATTCEKSPAVQELQRLRAERDVLRQEICELEQQRDAAIAQQAPEGS